MPIRLAPPARIVSLKELLHFLQFDRFWPEVKLDEPAASPFDVLKINDHEMLQGARWYEAAVRDAFVALQGGAIVGRGRYSNSLASSHEDWPKKTWHNHAHTRSDIDPDFWSLEGINWEKSSAKNPGGEFVDIVFSVEEILKVWPSDVAAATKLVVPASDRIVRRDDNRAAFDEAVKALDETISAVETANDIGDLTAGERAVVLSDLKAWRSLLGEAKIRVGAFLATLKPTLEWAKRKAAGTLVEKATEKALEAFGKLLEGLT